MNSEFDKLYGPKVHDFHESLAFSHAQAEQPFWEQVYRKAFPLMHACINVREDGYAQRHGVDRIISLKNGRTIKVDEKVRVEDWDDILLERWSDEAKKKPGWVQKPLECDFIAYAFLPSKRCYLFPLLTLQAAWRKNGREWCVCFPEIRARNKGYVTVNVAVPLEVLTEAMVDAMCIHWD